MIGPPDGKNGNKPNIVTADNLQIDTSLIDEKAIEKVLFIFYI